MTRPRYQPPPPQRRKPQQQDEPSGIIANNHRYQSPSVKKVEQQALNPFESLPATKTRESKPIQETTQQQNLSQQTQPSSFTSANSQTPYLQKEDRIKIAKCLIENMNMSEHKVLAFRLGYDYEDIQGTTKTEKAIGIFEHAERRNNLSQMVDTIVQLNDSLGDMELNANFRKKVAKRERENITNRQGLTQHEQTLYQETKTELRISGIPKSVSKDQIKMLAQILEIAPSDIQILRVISGSTIMLLGLPKYAQKRLEDKLSTAKGRSQINKIFNTNEIAITSYEELPDDRKARWEKLVTASEYKQIITYTPGPSLESLDLSSTNESINTDKSKP